MKRWIRHDMYEGICVINLETGSDLTNSIQSDSSQYEHFSKYDSSIEPHAYPKQIAKFQVRWQKTYHSSRRSLKTYFIVTAKHHRPNFCNLRKLFMVNETAQCAIFSYLLQSKHMDSYIYDSYFNNHRSRDKVASKLQLLQPMEVIAHSAIFGIMMKYYSR